MLTFNCPVLTSNFLNFVLELDAFVAIREKLFKYVLCREDVQQRYVCPAFVWLGQKQITYHVPFHMYSFNQLRFDAVQMFHKILQTLILALDPMTCHEVVEDESTSTFLRRLIR